MMLIVVGDIQRLHPSIVTWWQVLLEALIGNSTLSDDATVCLNTSNLVFTWRNISIYR
jgi:hypothetical protein